ncbi:MAG TPA: hypothetical protein DCE41_17240 [Cytophagales bacterium]|nr:hypothetical protein [Cytophagales bacterium]
MVIASLGRQDSAYYLDAAAEPYQPYRYTLGAKDSAGLESPPAIPVVSQYNYSPPLDFGRISHRVDREAQEITIQWRWEHPQSLEEVWVYRAKAGESLTLYQTLTNGEIEFIDRQIALDTQYTYRVKGVLPNGQFSNWSEPIQIAY